MRRRRVDFVELGKTLENIDGSNIWSPSPVLLSVYLLSCFSDKSDVNTVQCEQEKL